jgi:phosphocarrier protein FPr
MVGLVIVAHSRALAEAVVDLVHQMASEHLRIAVAAGAGPQRQEFGTDATQISAAIQAVYSADGVLVLVDMGSAILSAEMALDFLPPGVRDKVSLCAAPFVEGAVAAGVQASLGADLETVHREALKALEPKVAQIGGVALLEKVVQPEGDSAAVSQRITLMLQNPHGLHARPAARLAQTAGSFQAEIWVTDINNGNGPAPARNFNALALLGAIKGHQLEITASGPDAKRALDALSQLAARDFGEPTAAEEAVLAAPAEPRAGLPVVGAPIQGIPVSEGVVLGALYLYRPAPPAIPQHQVEDPRLEWERLQQAIQQASLLIQARRQAFRQTVGEAEAAIFDAHLLILQDRELLKGVRERIFTGKLNAAQAWQKSIEGVAESYAALADAYQSARAADVRDAGNQVLFALVGGVSSETIRTPRSGVIWAAELTPAEVSRLDATRVLGLVTATGDKTSHSAILTRSLGIPALAGIDLPARGVATGSRVALDGFTGLLWVEPEQELAAEIARGRRKWLAERRRLVRLSQAPARLRDGRSIGVAANVGSLGDAKAAALNGADAIGVLRSEFLYLNRATPPGEEEQLETLREIARVMNGAPVIVRTLDVGGDKSLAYLPRQEEANPYLGLRAIRLSLRHPDIFISQLRAILRAGADYPLRVMYPMIAALDEVTRAKELLTQAHLELEREKLPHRWPVECGIMIETPSAALLASKFAPQVDFFSVGTNDLTQYTLAAERGNPDLTGYLDALHPGVLLLIKMAVGAAHQAGKWAAVCGEVAADLAAVPILVGLGMDELSMNPGEIPRVKAMIREIDPARARRLAEKALACASAAEVRRLVKEGA